MPKDTLESLMRRARVHARKYKRDYFADDFSQYVAVRALENPEHKSTIGQMWIDFLRVEGPHRRDKMLRPMASKHDPSEPMSGLKQLRSKFISPEKFAAIYQFIDSLKGIEREIFLLYFLEDLNLKQIGIVFGVSEGRICQIMRPIKRRMKLALEGIIL